MTFELDMVEREGCSAPVRVYKGFQETFTDGRYDLISIDAPFGGDMQELARVDVLDLMPSILSETFVILLDDCGRAGERNIFQLMREVLVDSGIDFAEGVY